MEQPKDYKALERKWYKKLKEEGFTDIEDTSTSERLLKSWHSFKYQNMDLNKIKAIKTYYEQASELINTYEFTNPEHKLVWILHADGIPEREIARRVKTYKKSMVHWIIKMISSEIK